MRENADFAEAFALWRAGPNGMMQRKTKECLRPINADIATASVFRAEP